MKNDQERDISWLREGFATASGPPDPEACPAPEKIWAAVRGELPPAEMREILDHTIVCPACAEDWRLAVAFDEETMKSSPSGTTPVPFRPSPFTRFKPYLAAAAAACVLTVIGLQTLDQPTPRDRGGNETEIHSKLAEGEALPPDRTLRWDPVPEAATYEVTVSTEDLRALDFVQDLETTEYPIPASALQGLLPGTKILWLVEAKGAEGQTIDSKTFKTLVR